MATYSVGKSKMLFDKALDLVAGGVSSKSRSTFEGYHPFPLFIERAEGSRLYDVDGNEYIDYLVALGATILGNANPEILDFVSQEMRNGSFYALPFELQLKVAEKLIQHVPCFERLSFLNSGTEANQMNIRLARAFTGKNLLLKFEGCYHGWLDNTCFSLSGVTAERLGPPSKPNKIPATGGMAAHVGDDLLAIPWNDVEILEKTIHDHKDEIAAVITEPYMCNSGCIPPNEGYLEAMRELTRKNNIVLIFDEVITGFRVGLSCPGEIWRDSRFDHGGKGHRRWIPHRGLRRTKRDHGSHRRGQGPTGRNSKCESCGDRRDLCDLERSGERQRSGLRSSLQIGSEADVGDPRHHRHPGCGSGSAGARTHVPDLLHEA